jgi:hypothetical protein
VAHFAGNKVIGPFIFKNLIVTGDTFLALRHVPVGMVFPSDGAPPHFSQSVSAFPYREFPDRWIGGEESISCHSRSPDLTPLDFFF